MTKRSLVWMGVAAAFAAVVTTGTVVAGDEKAAGKAMTETKEKAEAMTKSKEGAEAKALQVGMAAPGFTLTDQAGNEVSLSDFEGKTVVLEWTCPSCPFVKRHYSKDVMTMTTLAEEYGDEDVVWLAVDSSHFAKSEDHANWVKDRSIEYPILADVDGAVGRLYGAKTTPHMFVIDPEGNLAYEGAIDNDPRGSVKERTNYVKAALDAILAGEKLTTTSTKSYGCSVKYAKGV